MKKKDIVMVLCILFIIAALYGVRMLGGNGRLTQSHIHIEVNGHLYEDVPLSAPKTVTITQANGAVNIVEVSETGALMQYSTCDNQTCIHQGQVTLDNYEVRPTQGFIICLPNRVSVELVPGVAE